MVPPPPATNPVDQDLEWIGFGTEGNRNSIRNEGVLEVFDDFIGLTVSNTRDMASSFYKMTTAQGRINFGMRHVNYTLGIMYWEQDESLCSCTAALIGIADDEYHKALLGKALDSATLRKVVANQADITSKASYTGKLKDESTWTKWEVKPENYLSKIPGVNGVPLSYVLKVHAYPDCTTDFQGDFIAETID